MVLGITLSRPAEGVRPIPADRGGPRPGRTGAPSPAGSRHRRVIVTAAAINHGLSVRLVRYRRGEAISEFGVGLAVAVLADAFLLRMTVIPALMHLIGERNLAIPSWLDQALPHVSVGNPGTDSPAHTAGKPRTPAAVEVS